MYISTTSFLRATHRNTVGDENDNNSHDQPSFSPGVFLSCGRITCYYNPVRRRAGCFRINVGSSRGNVGNERHRNLRSFLPSARYYVTFIPGGRKTRGGGGGGGSQ